MLKHKKNNTKTTKRKQNTSTHGRNSQNQPALNLNEIKKVPSRTYPGGNFNGIYVVGNIDVCTLNTRKIMHKIVHRNE